jgi:DNA-binding beta-propeller fold protein YncE
MTRGGRGGTGRRLLALAALGPAVAALAGCGRLGGQHDSRGTATAALLPEHILRAPKNVLAMAPPQANGDMWVLAGRPSAGLFMFSTAGGGPKGSVSVSAAAHSVTESSAGVIGVALGTRRSGALELLDGKTTRPIRTVSLPAPGRQVVTGSDGTTFYVLTAWATSASVTIVNSQTGAIRGTIPVPKDTVSVTPDVRQSDIYVLERTGLVEEIAVAGGKITARFKVGVAGRALALSPDGSTLYVLKGADAVSNVAVVDTDAESVHRVLPAPSHCHGLLVSANGGQLYEVVGTASYGNIQVFAV